LPCRGKVRQF